MPEQIRLTIRGDPVQDYMQERRPGITVSEEFLTEHSLSDGEIIQVDTGEEILTVFLIREFDDEPALPFCRMTEELAEHLADGTRSIEVSVADPPSAEEIRLGKFGVSTLSMNMVSIPPKLKEELQEELLDSIRSTSTPVYTGQRFSVSRNQGGTKFTLSITVREMNPGLVCSVGTETDLRVQGIHWL